MAFDTFLLYLATWSLFALSPGPAVLFVMSQGARFGQRGAIAGTTGILLGHVVCFTLVAFGLAALLARFSTAVDVIRIAGALYLIYLGVKMLLSKAQPPQAVVTDTPPAHHGIALQGLAVQLTNPKNLLFVLALLPQFIDRSRPVLPQLAIMFVITVVVDGAFLMSYAQLAVRGARALKGSRVMLWIERVFGAAIIFFGIKLLATRR
ncbi:MAG TPA: LysE family translocator [Steroidobacteraceae bacterium]|nr:LysE family translocator [Steroidobacteraceae bacterium]